MSVDPSSYDEPMALLPERIRAKIEVAESGCWLWTAQIDRYGYGRIRVGSQTDGSTRKATAHRVTYAALRGEIPVGLECDHLCHVEAARLGECTGGVSCVHRRCVNPWHLEVVTHRENALRSWRAVKSHCAQGHPYDEDNTYLGPQGGRQCRTCNREAVRRSSARRRAALVASRGEVVPDA